MDADWDHLKVALAVSRAGSLTAAAHMLGMDQTTAGRRLSALEAQLENPLFIRAKSGFSATEAGQVVIDNAKTIETQLAQMQETLDSAREGAVGLLRVMGNTWMLQKLAETVLPTLLEHHPRLEIRLSNHLPPVSVYSEPTVSLWFDAAAAPPDQAIPLCSVPYATYHARNRTEKTNDWVQFQDDIAQGPSFSRQLRKRINPNANVRLTATDAQVLQAAVRAGAGQCVLPMCLGDADPALKRSQSHKGEIRRVLHVHVSPEVQLLKRVALFIDALRHSVEDIFSAELLGEQRTGAK